MYIPYTLNKLPEMFAKQKHFQNGELVHKVRSFDWGPLPPSVYLGRRWRHSRDKKDQVFPLCFCILQAIKHWTVGRPENKSSRYPHIVFNKKHTAYVIPILINPYANMGGVCKWSWHHSGTLSSSITSKSLWMRLTAWVQVNLPLQLSQFASGVFHFILPENNAAPSPLELPS